MGPLPIHDVILQDAGLDVQRVRFRPGGSPNRQELDLTYTGDTAPEEFVELLENLQKLIGVHRVTNAVAVTNHAIRPDQQGSGGTK